MEHFFVDDILHLVIANRVDSEQDGSYVTTSSIWWLKPDTGNFELVDTIITNAASDVLVAHIESRVYIVFANEFEGSLGAADYSVPVQVYE